MVAYQTGPWHDLFTGVMSATAALAGLIFVAVSLNNDEILKHPRLPALAARSIATLIALVFMSAFVLTPGQPARTAGIEIAALGAALTAAALISSIRGFGPDTPRSWRLNLLTVTILSTAPIAIAGISLAAGYGGGLYWALAGSITGIAAPVYYSWILLVEVRR